MRRKKIAFENLNPDEQQQVHLENLKLKILECKKNIENNTVSLGLYLASVKEQLPHGEFGKWIEDNVGFSERTARRYMKVYKFREDFMTCETIEESDKREHIIGQFSNGQLMELSKLSKKDANEFINEDTAEELQDLSMAKLSEKIKEFKESKKNKSKTDSNDRFETKEETPTTQITTDLVIKTDTNKIFLDTVNLNNELRNRVGSDEDLAITLVARYNAKEISHQELSDIIVANKLNIPIFFNKKSLDEYLDRYSDNYYSSYEQYDFEADKREDRIYYSIFARELEWEEAIKIWDDKDEGAIDWGKSNHVGNDKYQLAESYIDTSKYLCIYKDYKLLGTFLDGDLSDIERLGTYDRRNIPVESLKRLKTLYEQLQEQLKDYV